MVQPRDALRKLVAGDWTLLGGFSVLFLSLGATWFKHEDPAVSGMIDPYTPFIHTSSNYYVHGLSTTAGGIVLMLAMLAVAAVANRVFEVVAVPPVVSLLVPLGAGALGLLCILLQAAVGEQAAETRAVGLFVAIIGVLAMVVGAALHPALLRAGAAMTSKPVAASGGLAGGANTYYQPSAPSVDPTQYGYAAAPNPYPYAVDPAQQYSYAADPAQQYGYAAAPNPYPYGADPAQQYGYAAAPAPQYVAPAPAPAEKSAVASEAICAACGTPFQAANSRFCRNCGAQRRVTG